MGEGGLEVGAGDYIYLGDMLGKGIWRWGEEGDYILIATLSPPE